MTTTPTTPSTTMTSSGRAHLRRAWHRISIAAAFAAVVLGPVGVAGAQEFVKVDDAAREQLPATPFIGLAYGFIWVAILGYLFIVARGVGRVRGEIEDLRRRLDRAGADKAP